ncbi:lipase [Ramaria rubella]|nr:lipase [Ramaria rubella]
MFSSLLPLVLSGLLPFASGAVLPRQGAVTTVSSAQINAFTPYTFFASAAYCNPTTTINWSCGANCNANPGFIPEASGGDGSETQFWYVGFDPTLNTVVVGHQGTDPSEILADITDADFFLTGLDQTLFPGTSGLEVHNGFGASQARSAPDVLAAVQTALSNHGTQSVTIVGHSLGAAIALIDAVFLPLNLPSTTTFKFVGYSMPRVGNPAFADYLDAHFPDLTHINNKEDVVPILPGEFLGFQHPHGEIHINDSGAWDACAGDDNDSDLCSTGDVPNIFEGDTSDHNGPFNGITMGC